MNDLFYLLYGADSTYFQLQRSADCRAVGFHTRSLKRSTALITHHLKTENPSFSDIWDKKQTFDYRPATNIFTVGDHLVLYEYDRDSGEFSGRVIYAEVKSVMTIEVEPYTQTTTAVIMSLYINSIRQVPWPAKAWREGQP